MALVTVHSELRRNRDFAWRRPLQGRRWGGGGGQAGGYSNLYTYLEEPAPPPGQHPWGAGKGGRGAGRSERGASKLAAVRTGPARSRNLGTQGAAPPLQRPRTVEPPLARRTRRRSEESPPLSKSRNLHQVLERGDLSEVNSHKNSKSRLSEGGSRFPRPWPPSPLPHGEVWGRGAGTSSTRPKPASCAPERVLASPRLSQTTVAALKKLLRLQHRCWGDRPHTGHSLIWGGGLAGGGLIPDGTRGKHPPPLSLRQE
ncbi:unnamed protein product [Rangifer tarandus platyrhynchus]|uniref:Uncharacterized protein n=2 Tax=Rangifer tarandus platyrhynchus TaxID=3082113 RepID=A0ACB0DVE5_RANTA|nr:unnamed protein product [Rangifer tarandus platyrhynchus]CAI9692282.1 unnamed protein product [Rangifer tarandus platyrhynchus]